MLANAEQLDRGMSGTNSPCAACRTQRRKCTQDCVFAPYFPPDNPRRFAYVHKVFGASNVAKILNDLNAEQREDAVKSLAYEAEARLRDPVYGCVGLISLLQHRLKQLQIELLDARKELAAYIGPQALLPIPQMQPPGPAGLSVNVNVVSTQPYHTMGINPTHDQQIVDAEAMAAGDQHEMMQQELSRLSQISSTGNATPSLLAPGPTDDQPYQILLQHHHLDLQH